ncbi:RHS repeat-associated core domain-containing protein, partial [Chryseobacterium tongliaoense]|uniref:RHS repeat-associated core domain-containing protein n=1 Tax=Chryseobacterium tongliaoense TaxID=3240933 RepID=UPI0035125CC5
SSLYKNTITDEDGNKTIEFKNGQGQVVLVRKVLSATENADTYYVYNEYNQLAFVVPPASPATLDTTALNNFCYQYRYDGRNRLVEKKLPGKGWEYMVYDKQDRLIMTQDANMKASGNWLFTKYDKFSRVVYTGIADIGAQFNRGQVQFSADYYIDQGQPSNEERNTTGFTNSGMTVYYGNAVYPATVAKVLSINYYDTYPTGTPTIPTQILNQNVLPQNAQSSNVSTKSLPVASYVKNIEDDNWTKNFTWYDMRGRVIGTHTVNHLGGYTKTETELDFAGVPQKVNTYHKRLAADTEKIIKEVFTYDNQNRLLTHTHQINSGSVEYLAQNKYNELSQLESKKVGGTSAAVPLQTVDYKYNIRGWMTKINDPANLSGKLFGYEIRYQNPIDEAGSARYNGNISEIDWNTKTDNVLRRYDYYYDELNRFNFAQYSKPNASVVQTGSYNEWATYDLNGNIKTMGRYGLQDNNQPLLMDHLQYSYTGNRLNTVKDISQNPSGYPYFAAPNVIGYDDNGNMTDHLDKGINKIIYNYLNLPNSIKKGLGISEIATNYVYRADGIKISKTSLNPTTVLSKTDYLDGFQYETTTGTAVLKFIPTSEGYYNFENNKYIYNYTDHLGNVRLSYMNNGSGAQIIEENNYYAFGLKHEGYNNLTGNTSYQYKYSGKELQNEIGMYDYGARFYMPDIGRWGVVDPLAEKSRRWSLYNYALNNPIYFTDPDGMDVVESASGTMYTGADAQSVFLALRNQLGGGPGPKIISRKEWGAKSPILGGGRSYEYITATMKAKTFFGTTYDQSVSVPADLAKYYNTITVHHSGNKDDYMSIQQLQQKEQDDGYADIPYHFAIDSKGNIYEGRPIGVKGSHVKGGNTGNIGIVLMSDLDTKNSGLGLINGIIEGVRGNGGASTEMRQSVTDLVSYLNGKYGIQYLGGHKEKATDPRNCPGDGGMKIVDYLRNKLHMLSPKNEN